MFAFSLRRMDLQSILNASDSDDDQVPLSSSLAHHQTYSDGSGNVDLEQLLRDVDGSDDEDDDDDGIGHWTTTNHNNNNQWNLTNDNDLGRHSSQNGGAYSTAYPKDNNLSSQGSNSFDDGAYNSQNFSTAHTAEDWAVLQALLGDDHEETEGDDDWMHTSSAAKSGSAYNTGSNSRNEYKSEVDAILLSDNDDDSDDNQINCLSLSLPPNSAEGYTSSAANHQSILSKIPMPRSTQIIGSGGKASSSDGVEDLAGEYTSSSNYLYSSSDAQQQLQQQSYLNLAQETASTSPILSSLPSQNNDTLQQILMGNSTKPGKSNGRSSGEQEEKIATERALANAQAYERKLLRSGHRDIVSPLMVKRRLKQKIELCTRAQRRNKPQQSSSTAASALMVGAGHHQQRFEMSGTVENKTMKGVSAGLQPDYLLQKGIKLEVGLPTALAMNSKFIAVGTQKGIVLVFDLFEVLKKVLDASRSDDTWNSKHAGSITSIDLNMNDEVLVSGYTSGFIVLWDTIRGVVLKTVTDTHPSPITSVRFLSDLKVVSVDAGGLVNKLTFAKTLWGSFSQETECLLDGTAGQILAMNVLPPISTVNPQLLPESANQLRRLVLIALSSERSSFAVAVEPSVNVLHRWAKPPVDRIESPPGSNVCEIVGDQEFLPCLSWGWSLVSGGGNLVAPILARAWGCCVQLLLASFPTIEEGEDATANGAAGGQAGETVHWPAFGLHGEFDVDEPIVALEWLNDRSLVYLTVTSEFTVVDTVMMTLVERLDYSSLKLVYAEFSLSRSVEKVDNQSGEASSTFCSTFQNSIRSSDKRLLVLCQGDLKCVSIVEAKKRITALEEDGEWLEALAVALDHYDNTVHSQEDRKRATDSRIDLSKHPEFRSATKNEDDEWIAKLLIRYLNLAVDNAPESPLDEHGLLSLDGSQAIIDLAQSHFQMLAGVCVEFCVVTQRLDLLFGQIFRRFQSVGFTSVFLDVLEPYVLNDKLAYIAPEAMTYFVNHCRATNGIATVERCLLHMDVRIMDFDSILSLLKKNSMYSALFYTYNQGLDEFIAPLEFLLEKLFDAADGGNTMPTRRRDGVPQNDFERLGYKALLYVQSCFRGKAFPKESDISPEERLPSLRAELLIFLLRERYQASPYGEKKELFGNRALKYPYTHILLTVDARALLEAFTIALDSPDGLFVTAEDTFGDENTAFGGGSQAPNAQQIVSMLSRVILPDQSDSTVDKATIYPAKSTVNAYLDFLAKYLMKGAVQVSKPIAFLVLTRISERFTVAKEGTARLAEQREILDLLTALPRACYDPDEVLELVGKAGIHRAALLLHQEGASWEAGRYDPKRRSCHFSKAIDCYLGDEDPLFRKEVFAYVKKECSGASESSYDNAAGEDSQHSNSLRESLFARMPDFVHLEALMTAELVAELFVDDLHRVVALMDKADSGESQFKFFQAIISGNLSDINPVAASVLSAHLTTEHHHKYLSLMAQLHPDLVYEYLSTHDNYRADECLKLCQDYNIADASAYLLERMGHVSSALQLILQTLESKMMSLKRTIRGMGLDLHLPSSNFFRGRKSNSTSLLSSLNEKQEKEVEGVKRLLIVALDLCERNSRTYSSASEHGSQLWFNVLDRLINAKGFLRLSKEQAGHAKIMASVLSELLRLTMQRMVSSVPLTDLVRKVTSDHSGSRLGELREMLDSLLSTYGFELKVFSGAVNVFHQDVHGMHADQRNLKLEGSGVSKLMNFPLVHSDSPGAEKENATAALFFEKAARSGSALMVGHGGNASFADGGAAVEMKSSESGLSSGLSKLRSRRGKTTEAKPSSQSRAAGLNFMTYDDQEYVIDKNYQLDNDFSDPVVGQLGEAEHRGRLMSFM